MLRKSIMGVALTTIVACNGKQENPVFQESDSPYGAPQFSKLESDQYYPAFKEAFQEHRREIDKIAADTAAPTFQNTIAALESSGKKLARVGGIFYNLNETDADNVIKETDRKVSPLLAEHNAYLTMNQRLWERIKTVYEQRQQNGLSSEQQSVLDKYYRRFVRGGALLSKKEKEELKAINKDLSLASIEFSDHVLAANNDFKLYIDEAEDLSGLPEHAILTARSEAIAQNYDGWVFTLKKSSLLPFMQYADNRALRQKLYEAYINRCAPGSKYDNSKLVKRILELRQKKARLFGYENFAVYQLEDKMAATPEQAEQLLMTIWNAVLPKVKQEAETLQHIIDKEGGHFKLQAWDWWYYSEKLRQEKFEFNDNALKPYFPLTEVRNGAFQVAHDLFGITIKPLEGVDVYHPDVQTFEVLDRDSSLLALFYTDYITRSTKYAGAWMNCIRVPSDVHGENQRPIVLNVCNFPRPVGDVPTLLNMDEVCTLFHEFGHALHCMLTKAHYPSVAGTEVVNDFVEFPSQLMEHWATEPEVLKKYARHYKTGEVIPDSLIQKMQNASNFNTGFETTELVAAALLDMAVHQLPDYSDFDTEQFEKNLAQRLGLLPQIAFRYRLPYFSHIFNGGYEVGYYSYLWSEVLDSDAFEAFKKHGLFDQETASRYRQFILEKGGSDAPMKLYKQFRGDIPHPEALLRRRGLVDETSVR